MKNVTILTFILLSTLNIFGQEAKSTHIGIGVTPKINKPIFENSDIGSGKNTEGLNIQFDILYDINSRVQLTSGINLSLLQISTVDYSPRLPCDISSNGTDIYNSWFEDRINIKYLGIPLGLKLKLFGLENHMYARLGIELLLKLNQKSESFLVECGTYELELENDVINKPSNSLLATNIGIGYEMKISNKYKFYVEPVMGYTITSIYDEIGITSDLTNNINIFSYGLSIGIRN